MMKIPDEDSDETTMCPALVESLTNAQTVREVRQLMAEHESGCPACNPIRKVA